MRRRDAAWGAVVDFPERSGQRFTPSRGLGVEDMPASPRAVPVASREITGVSTARGAMRPGHETMKGTRIPPSKSSPFPPRKGALLEVSSLVGPPLSLRKTMSVFSAIP